MNGRLIRLRPLRRELVAALIPVFFSLGLLALAVWVVLNDADKQDLTSLFCLFAPAVWLILALVQWRKGRWASRAWITVDDSVMQGYTYDQPFLLPWKEVLAAYLDEPARAVVISSKDQLHIFPLALWGRPLWEAIQERVPPAALEENAYQQLPGYVAAVADYERMSADPFVRLTHRSFPDFAVVPIGFLALFMLTLTLDGLDGAGIVYLLFALPVGAIALLAYERVEITGQRIVVRRLWRRYEMGWDEVERIEGDPRGMRLVWYGKNKRLVTAGINRWQAQSRDALIVMIEGQMRQRNIPWQQKSNAFAWSYDRSGRKGV